MPQLARGPTGQLLSPVSAWRTTFSESSAHLRRVAETGMPSRSSIQSASSSAGVPDVHADQLLGGDRRGGLRDRAAVALEAQVGDAAVGDGDLHAELVAAQRVDLVGLVVVSGQLAEVARALVVLEDEVAVEVVHQRSKTSCASRIASDQRVDVLRDVVGAEARARGRGDAQTGHQRLRAVVAGADAHAAAPEQLADVVGMDALDGERDDAAAVVGAQRPKTRTPSISARRSSA